MKVARPRILLVNPPIHDFSAHDFWLKPYGMLEVAGWLRGQADMLLFDYLDRQHPLAANRVGSEDSWGRGRYIETVVRKPAVFSNIPRHYRRFGLEQDAFIDFVRRNGPFDFTLIQSGMTYWYPGVVEVIQALRAHSPKTAIVIGGVYATLCPGHAARLGADLVVHGGDLAPLWKLTGLSPDLSQPALWEAYPRLRTAVTRLTDGCPMRCTYCAVPLMYGAFSVRNLDERLRELSLCAELGATDVAFYDDALLFEAGKTLFPFLDSVASSKMKMRFHTPNALHARFLTKDVARRLAGAGFSTFYIGLESVAGKWHEHSGGKIASGEAEEAVNNLLEAGVSPQNITAYVIIGHPDSDSQELEATMRYASDLGIKVMPSEYSPVPGTHDAARSRVPIDPEEPLTHNKTAYTINSLGWKRSQELKTLCRQLNRNNGS